MEDVWNATNRQIFLRLWDVDHGLEVKRVELSDSTPLLAFSPDGKFILQIDGSDAVVRRKGDLGEVRRIRAAGDLRFISFDPTGDLLATASIARKDGNEETTEHTVQLWREWNTDSPKEILRISISQSLRTFRFDSMGRNLMIASGNEVQLWNVAEQKRATLLQQDGAILATALSHDDRFIATAGDDHSVRVWDVARVHETARLLEPDNIIAVQFRKGDHQLALVGESGVVRLWQWDPEKLIKESCERLTRNLTPEESQRYLPFEPLHKTCSNLK